MSSQDQQNTGFHPHDHSACIQTALKTANQVCFDRKIRLTEVRQRVLEILLEHHTALGAYDVLQRLTQEGRKAQPPVVYRALDFLVANGLAHKIEHLNAFVACGHSERQHIPAFLICRSCKSVVEAEITEPPKSLNQKATDAKFQIESTVLEVLGLCPNCVD